MLVAPLTPYLQSPPGWRRWVRPGGWHEDQSPVACQASVWGSCSPMLYSPAVASEGGEGGEGGGGKSWSSVWPCCVNCGQLSQKELANIVEDTYPQPWQCSIITVMGTHTLTQIHTHTHTCSVRPSHSNHPIRLLLTWACTQKPQLDNLMYLPLPPHTHYQPNKHTDMAKMCSTGFHTVR